DDERRVSVVRPVLRIARVMLRGLDQLVGMETCIEGAEQHPHVLVFLGAPRAGRGRSLALADRGHLGGYLAVSDFAVSHPLSRPSVRLRGQPGSCARVRAKSGCE